MVRVPLPSPGGIRLTRGLRRRRDTQGRSCKGRLIQEKQFGPAPMTQKEKAPNGSLVSISLERLWRAEADETENHADAITR
ncbi:hypothetical protein GCM10007285_33040 [Stappia taiwanensis]|nr:hypothetical protein GCM10007285_33040 [Stappia taiwanensis]